MFSIFADTFTIATRQTKWADERYQTRRSTAPRPGWQAEAEAAVARHSMYKTFKPGTSGS